MEPLYRAVLLKLSPLKFQEHKAAKGERTWEEYFETEKIREKAVGETA
jgi:hypothetical protein